MEAFILLGVIVFFIYLGINGSKEKEEKQKRLREENIKNASLKGVVKCPKCLSTQTSANKQGVTLTSGLIGSQNVWITCLQCGHKWKAGK